MKKILYFLLLITLYSSCVQETELVAPTANPQVVVSGFINPDSVLKVKVTLSRPLNEKAITYPAVQELVFYENGKLLNYPITQKENGKYQINYFPKIGNLYKVQVITKQFGNVSAEDSLIKEPSMQLKSNVNPESSYFNPFYEISFDKIVQPCYLSMTKIENTGKTRSFSVLSSSNWLDPLGSFYDKWSGLGRIYEILYARIDDRSKGQKNISIVFSSADGNMHNKEGNEYTIFKVVSGSAKLDKYLKSLMLYKVNQATYGDGSINNPFAEASPVYSNVEGGLGFFGCAYEKEFRLD
jgi:hypothetical protein